MPTSCAACGPDGCLEQSVNDSIRFIHHIEDSFTGDRRQLTNKPTNQPTNQPTNHRSINTESAYISQLYLADADTDLKDTG